MIAPIEITGTVVGADQVITHFRARTEKAREIVLAHVSRATISVQNRVRFSFLSGQALRKRSGRLTNSINQKVTEAGDTITGTVGTKVPYGRFWELGFHGIQHVREHIRSKGIRHLGYGVKVHDVGTVHAHVRQVNQSARPFLRPALLVERPNIAREMEAAVREIVA